MTGSKKSNYRQINDEYEKKSDGKRKREKELFLKLIIALSIFLVFAILMVPIATKKEKEKPRKQVTLSEITIDDGEGDPSINGSREDGLSDDGLRDEDTIYSFLQGPKSWKKRKDWSGKWGNMTMETGNRFGAFGCGLCCIANVYDTLSPYEASPVDVYYYAKENTSYYPTGEIGAIGWGDMLSTLKLLGMDAEIANKPAEFKDFQKEMENSETAIILIICHDPEEYWGQTPGHYVSIWRYDPNDKTVFVANPGENSKNRKTIKLKNCYDHLKEYSKYQIIYIRSYDESKDEWKRSENIKEKWIRPEYCKYKF
ncbi:MAG: hypothetical protein K6F00_11505 [Lachnospiraceae bacterium]|nr:hypothetical protein [Lachnospiraceae bacterium]